MALIDKLTAIADAIRGKTGGTEEMTLEQMAQAIAGIETGGGDMGGAKLVTFTAASDISGSAPTIEIEHGLGKIPSAFCAINTTFIQDYGTRKNHCTWFFAGSSDYNARLYSTATANTFGQANLNKKGIGQQDATYCRADAEKVYLICADYRGTNAGDTICIFILE